MISLTNLKTIIPNCKEPEAWVDPLNAAMEEFGIVAPLHVSAFLAEAAHESSSLNRLSENLNYSWDRLAEIPGWKSRFPVAVARSVGRLGGPNGHPANQMMIANIAYALKNGNGDVYSGDGWEFRGSGIFGLTGRRNFQLCGDKIGVDIVTHPGLVREDKGVAARTGGWFWQANSLSEALATDGINLVTKRINPGMLGAAERAKMFEFAKSVLL